MKVILAGGSGQIGTILARHFKAADADVVILTRRPSGNATCREVQWDARTAGPWTAELEGADAVINLAGRSVNCRYTPQNRRAILESRVDSTRTVGRAIRSASRPPRLWLQMSTATIYAHRFDAPNDEHSGQIGGNEADAPDTWRFSIDVAKAWEAAATGFQPLPATRLVLLRATMTMSPDRGGVFDTLAGLTHLGLGGRAGDGRQFVSWIHETDFIRAVCFLVETESITGPVNLAAPEPLPNAEFMHALRQALGVRIAPPAMRWMLEIGAIFLRTETELILKSRRVVPGVLTRAGFTFQYPAWPGAARDLCARWRRNPASQTSKS